MTQPRKPYIRILLGLLLVVAIIFLYFNRKQVPPSHESSTIAQKNGDSRDLAKKTQPEEKRLSPPENVDNAQENNDLGKGEEKKQLSKQALNVENGTVGSRQKPDQPTQKQEVPKAGVAKVTGDPAVDQTIHLIQVGGPFPYPYKDGSVFQNREKVLPVKARGYYHEYTVPTPGAHDRGPRRIVTGGNPPNTFYFTADHYRTFKKLEVVQ